MQTTFYAPASKMRLLQRLVRQHDLRFVGQPLETSRGVLVTVSADHLPPGGANSFLADWARYTATITEVTSSWRARLRRRIQGRYKALLSR